MEFSFLRRRVIKLFNHLQTFDETVGLKFQSNKVQVKSIRSPYKLRNSSFSFSSTIFERAFTLFEPLFLILVLRSNLVLFERIWKCTKIIRISNSSLYFLRNFQLLIVKKVNKICRNVSSSEWTPFNTFVYFLSNEHETRISITISLGLDKKPGHRPKEALACTRLFRRNFPPVEISLQIRFSYFAAFTQTDRPLERISKPRAPFVSHHFLRSRLFHLSTPPVCISSW